MASLPFGWVGTKRVLPDETGYWIFDKECKAILYIYKYVDHNGISAFTLGFFKLVIVIRWRDWRV